MLFINSMFHQKQLLFWEAQSYGTSVSKTDFRKIKSLIKTFSMSAVFLMDVLKTDMQLICLVYIFLDKQIISGRILYLHFQMQYLSYKFFLPL